MSSIPDELRYTPEHEWVLIGSPTGGDSTDGDSTDGDSTEGGSTDGGSATARVGITDYAQSALGDVVYVSLPEVGTAVTKGATVGEVESTKSVSDVFAPLSGTVTARNEALDEQPDLINSDPYGAGWILEIELSDPAETADLLDAAAYGELAG